MSPLAPISPAALNARTPDTVSRIMAKSPLSSPLKNVNIDDEDRIIWDDPPSSPFDANLEQDNMALAQDDNITVTSIRSSKTSTDFSIFEDAPEEQTTPRQKSQPSSPSNDFSIFEHQKLETPELIETDEPTMKSSQELYEEEMIAQEEEANIDDTCFSTFSEVPNTDMTSFARLGQRSPLKSLVLDQSRTPRAMALRTPGTARSRHQDRSSSPTPRRGKHPQKDETTMLIDFTQQIESFSTASQRLSKHSPVKSNAEPQLLNYLNGQRSPVKGGMPPSTPGKKNLLNLLDFELPPAPTPRSIPTITVRELETLKSSYLSQISSLKATLSGREAEVESLKRAVGDAERRVGESQEQFREERSAREHAEKEKSEWEKRGTEVEQVLKSIKEEVMYSDRERDDLLKRLEDADRRIADAEAKAADAEARAAEAKIREFTPSEGDQTLIENGTAPVGMFTAEQVQKQIDERLTQLGSELHVIYKEKHINKVANLKARNQKEMGKLKSELDELKGEVTRLAAVEEKYLAAQDGTLSGPQILPSDIAERERDLKRLEEQKAELEEQKAKLAGLAEEVRTVRIEHAQTIKELEQERIEKGELVAAVDEMLALQSDTSIAQVEDFRKSISRPASGLRGPGFGTTPASESRIGRIGAPSGLGRSISGGKSKMMRDLERMGNGRNVE